MLARKRLNELFCYNEETGVVTRKITKHYNAKKGDTVGCMANTGYMVANVDGKLYLLHRVIWTLVYGKEPNVIDHINGNKTDNTLGNLRDTDFEGNSRNSAMPSHNTSGCVGVNWCGCTHKWRVFTYKNNKRVDHGRFENYQEAVDCRLKQQKISGYHPNHGRTNIA